MELLDCTAFLFLNFGGAPYLHSGYSNLHPHQQGTRVPVSSHPCQHLFAIFLDNGHLTSVRQYHTAVLICISLMISDVEHLFMCLVAIWVSFLWVLCTFINWVVWCFFFSDVVLYAFFSYFWYWSVIVSGCCNLSKAFSEYTEVTVWFLFLSLLMWCIMPTDLWTEAPRCPGGSSLQCRTPGLGSQMWGSEPTLFQENLYDCDHLLFCGSPTWQCGLNYTMSLPLLPISWRFLLYTFSCGKSFLLVFRSFLSIVDL